MRGSEGDAPREVIAEHPTNAAQSVAAIAPAV
jgi:hypothetical protein